MSDTPPYMQLWIADFIGDTLHLSDAEVGQYILILMAMWRNGGMVHDDPVKLSRIARNEVSDVVMALLSNCLTNGQPNGCLTQKRLLTEFEKATVKSQKRRAAGIAGVEARALKNNKRVSTNGQPHGQPHGQPNGEAKVKHLLESESEIDTPNGVSSVRSKKSNPRQELEKVLDQEHANAVLDHRQRIKKPLTAHAAKLLAGKFASCAEPNIAADAMISNGWTGFEPEWLLRRQAQGPPPGTEEIGKEAWRKALRKTDDDDGQDHDLL